MTKVRRTLWFGVAIAFLSSCCDEASIPRFRSNLQSKLPGDRNDAALQLARCGSAANAAVPRLAQLLYDENKGVQSSAAYALRKIDSAEARKALEEVMAVRKRRKEAR
jgi:HEAT repeat protein